MATPTNLPGSFSALTPLAASTMNNLRGAFRVLQVVEGTYSGGATNNTNVYADTGLQVTITPSSTSSKVLLQVNMGGSGKNVGNAGSHLLVRIVRGATVVAVIEGTAAYTNTSLELHIGAITGSVLDSPATTSAITYKVEFRNNVNAAGVFIGQNSTRTSIIAMEISA